MFGLSWALAEIENIKSAAEQAAPRKKLVIFTNDPLLWLFLCVRILNTSERSYYVFEILPSLQDRFERMEKFAPTSEPKLTNHCSSQAIVGVLPNHDGEHSNEQQYARDWRAVIPMSTRA
jgi:hypothetical protein